MKTIILLNLIVTLSAFAGREGGNGGVVVKCGAQITLADFYEGRDYAHGDPEKEILQDSVTPIETQVEKAFEKLLSFRAAKTVGLEKKKLMERFRDMYHEKKRLIPESEKYWSFTNDLGPFKKLPESCHFENVIHFFNSKIIDVIEEYYTPLSKTSKAALWVHEVIYEITRQYGEVHSHAARRIVAALFSQFNDLEVMSGLIIQYLSDKPSYFVDRENLKTRLNIQLSNIRERHAENHAPTPKVDALLNKKKVCETVPRKIRLFGTKEVCRFIEEDKADFDTYTARIWSFAMSGTRVSFTADIELLLDSEIIQKDNINIYGLTGEYSLNAYYLYRNYYFLSERTYNFLFGRQ